MLRLTRPRKSKKPEDPVARARDLELVLQRCKSDVAMTRAAYNHPRLRPLPPEERRLLLLDAEVNARGVTANVPFLKAAHALTVSERTAINARLSEITGGTVTTVDQVKRIKEVVQARGHKMTTVNKRSVAAVLAHRPDDFTREVLTLRQRGAFASTLKFNTLLQFADPSDHRIRRVLRFHGAGPGRWTSLGAQLHNLTRNDDEVPASLLGALAAGNYAELARFGNPLRVVSQLSRAALCAAPRHELICADLSAIESRITAWLAGESWKLDSFRRFDATSDKALDLYRILAHLILRKNTRVEDVRAAERQLGKYSELAFNFGGASGAWRKIVGDDGRSDAEVLAIVQAWRAKHPATRAFWRRLMRAALTAIHAGRTVPVNPPPLPPITAAFDGRDLTITLPSGRAINYPGARIVPNSKFEDGEPDVEFFDNEKGQWKAKRAWFGIPVENTVQGIARDLLAAAIVRAEARGWRVVFHCHDEVVIEAPIGAIPAQDVLALLLEPPAWAAGLPLGGKVRSGPLFLEAPATAEPPAKHVGVEHAIDINESADESVVKDEINVNEDASQHIDPAETGFHVELVVGLPDDQERAQRESPKFSCDFDGASYFAARETPDTIAVAASITGGNDTDNASDGVPPWGDDIVIATLNGTVKDGEPTPAPIIASKGNGFSGYVKDVQGYDREKISCPFHEDRTPSCQLYPDGHYHCLGGETKVMTWDGNIPIKELTGGVHRLLTTGGVWVDAPIKSFGTQQLWRISLSRSGVRKDLYATNGHRWFVHERAATITTENLRTGHRLAAVFPAERFTTAQKTFARHRWQIRSVKPTDRFEEVFCAQVTGTAAFAIEDNILTGNCFGCGAHGSIAEDMDLPDDVLARVANTKDSTHTLERGLELWDESKPIAGTLAERYLTDTRKLDLAALPNGADAVLRFHPRCPFGANGARHPCLLALFRDVESDAPAGIHRIGLTPDAQKIRRLTLGRWPGVRAIKLWPVTHKLTIGEGIETVLGAIRCGAITPPAWAMGPKTNIASFPVLSGVKAITVLVDRGDPAALDGAEACIARYVAAGIPARWLRTARVKDFNDLALP
jgi:DNA polymerase